MSPCHKQASVRRQTREAPGTSAARVHRPSNHCCILNMVQIQRLSDLMSLCSTVRFSEETFSLIQPGPGDYPRSLSALIVTKGQTVDPGSYALRRESSCVPRGFPKRYLIGAGSMPGHSTTDLLKLFRRVTVQKTSQV